MSPLVGLHNLATMLGVGGIWIKDESVRMDLGSFKVLGGSYAIYRFIKKHLGIEDREYTFAEFTSPEMKQRYKHLVFATATDGNHGRGVAWAATQLGLRSIVYVHIGTSQARIDAIAKNGAEVKIISGTYDDAVRQVNSDANKHGWQVISDTSWEGYEDIPRWVMQGYSTLFNEAQLQLSAQGVSAPTHIFVQAGVGALAASAVGFYRQRCPDNPPKSIIVEPDKAACLWLSAREGKRVTFSGQLDTIMAGLACGDPSPLAWRILSNCAEVFAVCPDYVAAKGMRVYGVPLAGDPFVVSGESGAVTLGTLMFLMAMPEATALRESLGLNSTSHILLINTEGNTDPDDFRRIVWEGGDPVPEMYKFYKSEPSPA
jgi:diaminopropionate ammonia-lyase